MGIDRRTQARLGWIAAAAAPLFVVQAANFLWGSAPATAAAQAPEPWAAQPAAPVQAVPLVITPEQQRALEWLETRSHTQRPARSPMHQPVQRVGPVAVPVATGEPELPKMRLGGVASRRGDSVASINNRLLAVGDEPVGGWTIERIEPEARRVTLLRYDGKRFVLTSDGLAAAADEK